MKEYKYPFIFSVIYKYGNIPITLLLLLYLVSAIAYVDTSLIYIIPVIINLLLIYFLNKHYLMLYKIVPYTIRIEGDELIGSNFIFRKKKEVIINLKDVDELSGGIFAGRLSGLMKIRDGKSKVYIGFYNKIKNAKELETLILSKVRKEVYDSVVERLGLNKK